MDLVVVALFWLFCAWLVIRRQVLLAFGAAIAFIPFGSMAAIPAELTGGLTLLPAPVLSLIGITLFVSTGPGRQFIIDTAFSTRKLGLLTIFLLIAGFSAIFYPRIFAGMAEVVPMRGELSGYGGGFSQLAPTPQNLSQLFYLAISTSLIFCFAFVMQFARYQQVILKAIFISGIVTVVTGVLDYASQYANIGFLLAPFRTATYSLLTEHDVLDAKRVVGLMPEASSFGPMCVGRAVILLLWRDAFESPRIRRAIMLLVPLLFLFGFLSTSSSAYLAIGVAAVVLGLRAVLQMFGRRPLQVEPTGILSWRLLAVGGVAVLVAFYALNPGAFSHIEALVDRMVVGKTSSSSFDERMAWNTVSLQALADTYGIGVGVGGTRASSWPVSLVTNLGIPGALVLLAFMAHVFLRRKTYLSRAEQVLCRGGAWAMLPLLSSNALTGTSPDLGLGLALILGTQAACGVARRVPRTGYSGASGPPVGWRRPADMGQL